MAAWANGADQRAIHRLKIRRFDAATAPAYRCGDGDNANPADRLLARRDESLRGTEAFRHLLISADRAAVDLEGDAQDVAPRNRSRRRRIKSISCHSAGEKCSPRPVRRSVSRMRCAS